ncbi:MULTISPECIES: sensor histidine kinase [unclassified Nocardioides]|uniref:sensor histidine kinase n=1 Tax=unclassified Nocardioides TaxID=2615069 RepID=UPI0006F3075A|nr:MULTISPECIES: sensor histidine kinase [unclassified Nocardioides]KQY57100.1 histidine kinase [Nocardioides sp. Root140]KRF11740.1 histidine kinase [Nocardioides sp. Soil796]
MRRPTTAWAALAGNPLRFLTSSWPWRSWAYLAGSSLTGLLALVVFIALVLVGIVTSLLVIGLFVLASLPLMGAVVGTLERRRLRLMAPGQPLVPSPHPPIVGKGVRAWFRQRRREEVPRRELGYTVLLAVLLWVIDLVLSVNAVLITVILALSPLLARFDQVNVLMWQANTPLEALPITLVGVPVAYVVFAYALTAVAAGQSALARILLGATDAQLEAQVGALRRSRLDLVDAFETERKRIERHLHDGVQQRLVALTMTLGRAELDVPDGPALDLVRQAHGEAEAALADLREAVRGIHPRVLVDLGVEAAVREVADRMPMPVSVDIALPRRLPAPVEAAAYFVVSEALTNVARHADARSCRITGWIQGEQFVLSVADDGVGGAAVGRGSGLAGLVTRLDALGGTLGVDSPSGGPTQIRMECPCRIDP